jgi:3-oxoacyl-[acyl-carrier-protein] synthase III
MQIKAIEYFLPNKLLTNNEIEQLFPDWSAQKVEEKTGIKERHIAAENETALDLAISACNKLFLNFDKQKIDFILFCTQSPDYYLPTTACILQDKLGLSRNTGALDFNLGCSGYVYGLALAKGLISSGVASCVLLITAETYSKLIHPKDKGNRSIFGDGAAATIIEKSNTPKLHEFVLGTDGSGYQNLIVCNGAIRNKYNVLASEIQDDGGSIRTDNNLFMNGPEIFNFTIGNVPSLVTETLTKNNTTLDNIDYVIFHQANKYMLSYLRKKIKIAEEKFYINLEHTGNTVSATIPIALKDCLDKGIVKPGNKVLLVGFGVGYSWGATVIEL